MPSRIDRYRMVDGVTPIAARYFNPIWQDVDLRLVSLEGLSVSWEEAVRRVSDLGLTRINEVLRPALDAVEQSVHNAEQMINDVEQSRQAALAHVAELEQNVAAMATELSQALAAAAAQVEVHEATADADIATWKAARLADIEVWKSARLAELDAWRADLAGALPAIEARLQALEDTAGELAGSSETGRALLKAESATSARGLLNAVSEDEALALAIAVS